MSYKGKLLSMSGSVSVYVFVSVSASVLCPCLCLSVSVSVSVWSQEQEWRAGAGGEWQEGQACRNNKFSSQTKCFLSNKLVPLCCGVSQGSDTTSSFVIGFEDLCAGHAGDRIIAIIIAQATP